MIFFDESFRKHERTDVRFGVLMGVAIPEDVFARFQRDFYQICKPYFGTVLKEGHDVHGSDLLTNVTMRIQDEGGHSGHWSLAEDILNYSARAGIKVFGVVCFKTDFQSFVCSDETNLDLTFKYLFERVDLFMKNEFPTRYAKLVFDDRGRSTNEKNGRAITSFFLKSTVGSSYDSLIKTPLYGVSKSHNYGLQLADLVTTVAGRKFQGDRRVQLLWEKVHQMLYIGKIGNMNQSSLKVMR